MTIPKRLVYLILLALLAINLPLAAREFRLFRTETDLVSLIDTRLAPVISQLPAYGEIGYQFDPRAQPDGSTAGTLYSVRPMPNHDTLVNFTIVQFALAPRILVNSTDCPQVVGCFNEPMPKLGNSRLPVKDFGNGICLIQKGK
jgi:hypothetical protein